MPQRPEKNGRNRSINKATKNRQSSATAKRRAGAKGLRHRYCTYIEVNKSLQKSLLNLVLTTFSEALVAALSVPDSSHASDAGLKTQVPYISRKSELEPAKVSAEPYADHLL